MIYTCTCTIFSRNSEKNVDTAFITARVTCLVLNDYLVHALCISICL